jgi:F-type H+-transporting ATPase subunit alpha
VFYNFLRLPNANYIDFFFTKKHSTVAQLVQILSEANAFRIFDSRSSHRFRTCSSAISGPISRVCLGEYFHDNRMHTLIIYDDLSKHVVTYRQMALLLGRPPGREAFPGVFSIYIHVSSKEPL